VAGWILGRPELISLTDVIDNARPSILIGVSAQAGAFEERIVRTMAGYVDRPIILPLSNPTSRSEATPADLISWTDGRALVATGSPFLPVTYDGRLIRIGQCNNALIFPGMGLGIIASRSRRVTDTMFAAAADALAEAAPALLDINEPLYPGLQGARQLSQRIALAAGLQAQAEGLAETSTADDLQHRIAGAMWSPRYARYGRVAEKAPQIASKETL
jgi:malate dehydrogenase (oxaloacetate-decarboxylating)